MPVHSSSVIFFLPLCERNGHLPAVYFVLTQGCETAVTLNAEDKCKESVNRFLGYTGCINHPFILVKFGTSALSKMSGGGIYENT